MFHPAGAPIEWQRRCDFGQMRQHVIDPFQVLAGPVRLRLARCFGDLIQRIEAVLERGGVLLHRTRVRPAASRTAFSRTCSWSSNAPRQQAMALRSKAVDYGRPGGFHRYRHQSAPTPRIPPEVDDVSCRNRRHGSIARPPDRRRLFGLVAGVPGQVPEPRRLDSGGQHPGPGLGSACTGQGMIRCCRSDVEAVSRAVAG